MPQIYRLLSVLVCLAIGQISEGQVNANFTVNQTEGCGSLLANFCDNSSSTAGSIVAWSWDLSGATSNNDCASRIFTAGTYTICLTVTDNMGNTDTECKTDLIRVYQLPVADFDATPVSGCVPLDVSFNDRSSSADGTITNWLWGLGGNCGTVPGSGASPSATCTYTTPGQYSISLLVTDNNGCTQTATKSNYITANGEPEISVSANTTFGCTAPLQVTFTNSSPSTNIQFRWDFGNGVTFTGTNPPPVLYTTEGCMTVTVIAEDMGTGCTKTLELPDYICIGREVNIGLSQDIACVNENIVFSDISPEPADSVVWDFGDGNSSKTANPSYRYSAAGCYNVTLTRWVDGCDFVKQRAKCIQVNPLPLATYNNNNSLGCSIPHVVNFGGIPQSSNIVSWEWDFGDGSPTVSQQNPIHVYNEYGDFPVTLTVTDANGCSNSVIVNSIAIFPLEAEIIEKDISGCSPLSFTVEENSTSITPISDWNWIIETPNNTYTSNTQVGTFTIPDTGVFDVKLIVINTLGCPDTVVVEDMVTVGQLPNVDFVTSSVRECIEVPISFTNLSSNFAGGFQWTFGDGDESFIENPIHEFQDTGFYDITLTVSHNGCENTLVRPDYIQILEPLAKFNVVQNCDDILRVEFVDRSVGAERVEWDFGVSGIDTDTSTQRSPFYIFPQPGVYTVSQTAYNSNTGCDHTETIVVTVADPEAKFGVPVTQGCMPFTLNPVDSSDWAVQWEWSAPGGTIPNPRSNQPSITYNASGKYTDIQLIITDVNGCMDTTIFTDTIYVNEINPGFTVLPSTGCFPLNINLNDASTNLFANNTQWNWNVGNVGTASGENASFVVNATGTFPVTLTLQDDWGCVARLTLDSVIDVTQPVADFTAVDTFSCVQHCIQFDDFSNGKSLSYLWDFGDGQTSTLPTPEHCYNADGRYTVCLTVTDIYGCDSTFCRTDYINISSPVASFNADSTFASCPPLEVNFNNTSQNATSYFWDFGDANNVSTEENPSNTYFVPGKYEVTLIASSTPNCHDTLAFDDLIVLDGPEGSFSFEVDSTCAPVRVTLMAESIAEYTYIWDFGDGVTDSTDVKVMGDTIVYEYTESGRYLPTVSFIDNLGCLQTYIPPSDIYVSELRPDFQASDTLLCDNNPPVNFANLTFTTDPDNLSFEWIFDGATPANSAELIPPAIAYTTAGAFDVTLIARNDHCTDTLHRIDHIGVGESPNGNFLMDVDRGCEPLVVQFSDASSITTGNLGSWFWDFGDGFTSNAQNPTHTFTGAGTYEVTMIVFSDVGCMDTIRQQVVVIGQTPVTAGRDKTICMGEAALLEAEVLGDTTGVSYDWSPAATLSCSDCLNPVASPLDTTTYTLTITNADGCTTTASAAINVRPVSAPVITLTPDTIVCANGFVQLNVGGGDDIYSYQWDSTRSGLSCYDYCLNPIATPQQTTSYVVTVTNQFGCQSMDSVQVEVVDSNQVFASEDVTICAGDAIRLSTNGFGTNPFWQNSNGLDCSYCEDPLATPDDNTAYVVEVTTSRGCKVYDTVNVFIVRPDEVSAGSDVSICPGTVATLTGTGAGFVSWSPVSGLSDPTILNPSASPATTTTYTLTVENGNCILQDEVTVFVSNETVIQGGIFDICEGESIELVVDGLADTYSWSPVETLSADNIPNPIASPNDTTIYTLTASLATCSPATVDVIVNVRPNPPVTLSPRRIFFPGETLELNIGDDGLSSYEYSWTPAEGLSCDDCARPLVTPEGDVSYRLSVLNPETDCITEMEVDLEMLEDCPSELIYTPNIFSPNGDGLNDLYEVFPTPSVERINSIQIFDRWGNTVFQANDASIGWDGTAKGQKLPTGVYVFVVEAPCPITGDTFIVSGDITLIR